MSYHVHHTEAIILSSYPVGEGDRLFRCFTREMGLVFARAKSVREGRSRLRYALQPFSHVELDLIRGKHGWKIISSRLVDTFADLWKNNEKRRVVAQYAHLTARLVQGEERHDELFEELLTAFSFLRTVETAPEVEAAELTFVIRLLAHLGYWDRSNVVAEDIVRLPWGAQAIFVANKERHALLREVNRALAASQL
jgi:DNA repair protein RecO (recombination protein O)